MDDLKISSCSLPTHARLEPSHNPQPVVARSVQPRLLVVKRWLHHHRNVNVRRVPNFRTREASRRHSHNRERRSIQRDTSSHNRKIEAEATLPVPVANDGNRAVLRRLLVLARERMANGRTHSEKRKETAGDNSPLDRLGLTVYAC